MRDFVVDIWGPMACFTPAYAKVERFSSAVPTPSAMRGVLAAIYSKPEEFYWVINKIEVMNPISYLFCKRNEVDKKMSGNKAIVVEDIHTRTQRTTMFLKDVKYRVTASLIPRKPGPEVEAALRKQALRRIEKGQCFNQPYLGTRECSCYFALADMTAEPIPDSMDLNLMLFDTHVPYDNRVGVTEASVSLYHCQMVHGVIEVPDYDSPDVIKIGGGSFATGIV